MMMKVLLIVAIFPVFVPSFYCDECPVSEVQKDFKIDWFLGDWYVVELLRHSQRFWHRSDTEKKDCLKFNVSRDARSSEIHINMTGRIGAGTHEVGPYENSAVATVPDPKVPGRWSTTLNDKTYVTDILTSNNRYAVMRMCRQRSVTGAWSDRAYILSRQPTLDQISIKDAEQALKTAGADTDKLKPINQLYCSLTNN